MSVNVNCNIDELGKISHVQAATSLMWIHTFVGLPVRGRKAASSGGHFAVAKMSILPFGAEA